VPVVVGEPLVTPQEHFPEPLAWPHARLASHCQWALARLAAWPWHRIGLSAITLLAAALRLLWIDGEGYANTYYAAAVKSMLTSWPAFFFGSFDPAGFVAVDKPPLGLWIQAASARLLGFDGVSLILPQALAGIASVIILYHLIKRPFGPAVGLFAALALALTPVVVVTDRNNTPDSLVVLAMLGAIWATTLAMERGDPRWLLAASALVGLGFNVKMLQGYLVVPALVLTYALLAPHSWRLCLQHLAMAALALLGVTLSWSLVVDLIPASQRPYVGSSGTNSALSLALGYNGLGRLAKWLGLELGTVHIFGLSLDLAEAPGFAPGIGSPGPFRLVTPELAGQVSWLLPLALIGLVGGGWWLVRGSAKAAPTAHDDVRRQRQAILLWGTFLLTQLLFFSVADFFHTYYLITLGAPVAAMAAIAVTLLWRAYQGGGWGRLWLPLALVATALAQAVMLMPHAEWSRWLIPLIVGGVVLSAAALLIVGSGNLTTAALAIGALLLLAAPASWSAMAASDGSGGSWLPYAGPSWMSGFAGRRGDQPNELPPAFVGMMNDAQRRPMAMTFAGPDWDVLDDRLLAYLQENQGSAQFLAATESSSYASVIMLATDEPAMALGGYQGWDEILSPSELADLVRRGVVRFFLLSAADEAGSLGNVGIDVNSDLTEWVHGNCQAVPESTWQGRSNAASSSNASQIEAGTTHSPMTRGQGRGSGAAGFGFARPQQLFDCTA
jgi:4-amino-4-deoxy-L-arabinose transferase-like glycosyltransferase